MLAFLQVLIAGAVIAGGYIVYNLIQNDPEARRAIGDAKGKYRSVVLRQILPAFGVLKPLALQVKPRGPGTTPRDRQRRPTVRPREEQGRLPTKLEHWSSSSPFH